MIRLGADFFPSNVKAFVSDINWDFKLQEPFVGLGPIQQQYLRPFGIVDSPRWIHLKQTHGKAFIVVDEELIAKGQKLYDADAAITNLKQTPISVRTADCQALFMYAPDIDTMAVVHAGWKGVHQRISEEVLRFLINVKRSNPEYIKVAFGPSIRACCFEVGEDVAALFPASVRRVDSKLFVDLIHESRLHLANCGVKDENIYDYGKCTFCSPEFFSYRSEGEAAGRMINVMIKD